jgi:hypothetical protein
MNNREFSLPAIEASIRAARVQRRRAIDEFFSRLFAGSGSETPAVEGDAGVEAHAKA